VGLIVINAALFYLVGRIVDGFSVSGFWPALGGALVVGITNMVVSQLLRGGKRQPPAPPSARPPSSGRDVIDI
jgi:putative membrane protein